MEQKTENTQEKNITINDLVLYKSELQARGLDFSGNSVEWKKYKLMRRQLLSVIKAAGIGLTWNELCHIIDCRQWSMDVEVNMFCKSVIRHKKEKCRLLGSDSDNVPFLKN